jgi:hypothetical protein
LQGRKNNTGRWNPGLPRSDASFRVGRLYFNPAR